jgi:hypothetical protein
VVKGSVMLKCNEQNPPCHAERSEASRDPSRQMLRCAQHDMATVGMTWPALVGIIHNHLPGADV